jgi:hypothetical protein
MFTPKEGSIDPGQSVTVQADFSPTELGTVHAMPMVTLSGLSKGEPPRVLDITANVVSHSLSLTMPGRVAGPVRDIAFGSMYYGQTRVVRAKITNNSPLRSTFAISVQDKAGSSEFPILAKPAHPAHLANPFNSTHLLNCLPCLPCFPC